jgi:hypothetical protein
MGADQPLDPSPVRWFTIVLDRTPESGDARAGWAATLRLSKKACGAAAHAAWNPKEAEAATASFFCPRRSRGRQIRRESRAELQRPLAEGLAKDA